MTRKLAFLLSAISLLCGCTSSDPMGLRSAYRGVVPPSSNSRPVSSSPVAMQPYGQPGQPIGVGQSAFGPNAAISNMTISQGQNPGWGSPYPMMASAGGQFDGRAFPFLTREVKKPKVGGSQHRKTAVRNTALAAGIAASPMEDLKYRGGRTIRDLKYMNIFVGGEGAWDPNDYKSIDKKLAAAMSDPKLNNVIMQYFGNSPVSSQFLGSFFYDWKPKLVKKGDLDVQIQDLYRQNAFEGRDLANTVVNFMLPRGVILGDPSGGQQSTVSNKAIPTADAEDSTGGLGGYHGTAHVDGKKIFYAVGVFSERRPNGGTNGIPVFNEDWKNVVATFYHELQEARTDLEVDDAATDPNGMNLLGWTSDSGQEIGDYPIAEAKQLLQVFKEVPLADGSGTAPIQLCYSNAVHGPEGPIDYPHGMEPPPGSRPPQNNPPPSNPNPGNPPTSNPAPQGNLPPQIQKMIGDWEHLDQYIKLAILKLLS
jgi:hypothetical protein